MGRESEQKLKDLLPEKSVELLIKVLREKDLQATENAWML
jgi:hypothetical protein